MSVNLSSSLVEIVSAFFVTSEQPVVVKVCPSVEDWNAVLEPIAIFIYENSRNGFICFLIRHLPNGFRVIQGIISELFKLRIDNII